MVIGRHESVSTLAVFISYAPEDEVWGEKLRTHLAVLQRQGLIVNWSHEQVLPGTLRESEIARHLDAAHIILLLMSPAYNASDHCYNVEMKRAMQRHATDEVLVIPILLSTVVGWDLLPVSALSPLPASGKPIKSSAYPEKALAEVANDIYRVVKDRLPKAQVTQTGYRSLLDLPPPSRPDAIVQRADLVELIYTQLIQPGISALSLVGMGGIGKSTLAALVYAYAEQQRHANQGPFSGETLWLKLDATVTLVDIIGSLRDALGQPAFSIANLSPERAALELSRTLNTLESPRLIILDQFETLLDPQTRQARIERPDVREWLDRLNRQSYACRILFTCRFSPRGTHPSPVQCLREYVVPFLTQDESSLLLHTWGVRASQAELQLVVQRCQGHALALALLGGLLKNDASVQLATFFNHPLYTRQRINTMAEELLNYIFRYQLEQEQRELLLAFSVYREAVPVEAALTIVAARSGLAVEEEQSLSAHTVLLAQHLLHASGNLCYQLHALVAEFAQQHFVENDAAANLRALCAAHTAAAHYYQQLALLNTLPREQRRQLDDVHTLIEAIWQYCHAQQQREAYALLVQEGLFLDLQRWGSNGVLLEIYQELLPAPHWQPAPEHAARIYDEIGEIYQVLGQRQKAQHYFELSLRDFRLLQQPEDIVNVLNYLGSVHRQQNQFEQALACYQEAKQLSDNAASVTPGSSMTLNNLGYVHYVIGRQYGWKEEEKQQKAYKEALDYFQQALSQYRAIGYFAEEARILNNMGKVFHVLGCIEEASIQHQQALELARKAGDRWVEATVLNDLAVLSKQKNLTAIACEDYYKQAILIFQEVGARGDEQQALKNLGYWYVSQKQYSLALAFFVRARNIYSELYYPQLEEIPRWIVRELRLVLGEPGLQALQADIETRAEQLVEQTLHV